MEKNEETKKMTLKEILEYANTKGMTGEALSKLEEIYTELLEDKDHRQSDDRAPSA